MIIISITILKQPIVFIPTRQQHHMANCVLLHFLFLVAPFPSDTLGVGRPLDVVRRRVHANPHRQRAVLVENTFQDILPVLSVNSFQFAEFLHFSNSFMDLTMIRVELENKKK